MKKILSIKDITPREIKTSFEFRDVEVERDCVINVCILSVSGKYPEGSKGSHVGEYLSGLSVFLREIYKLDVLIIDLSKLDYAWGNNLLGIASPQALQTHPMHDTWLGYYIVGNVNNKKALISLFCEFGKHAQIHEVFDSVEDAMNKVLENAKRLN